MRENELPEAYLERMRGLLGEEDYIHYIESFKEEGFRGLRANTNKISPDDLERLSPWNLEKIPWIPNGFYYGQDARPAKDPYYYAGLYYLQEPSAMTPASILPVTPGDMVLDLCAAPGGKSTELGAKLKGKGMVIANEISNSKAKALLKNLEMAGITNFCVTSDTPKKLADVFPCFFDKILVDAPCSGEGMFRKDKDMVKDWLQHGPSHYQKLQRDIAAQAVRMLKPGGYLMYSTCTFSMEEDEDIINYILEEFPSMGLLSLPLFEGAADGIGLSGCLRLFPHKLKGEGHFIALLYKHPESPEKSLLELYYGKKSEPDIRSEKSRPVPTSSTGISSAFTEFWSHCSGMELDPTRLMEKNGLVYYLPESFIRESGLRYLRTGLLMGEIKKERFEPSQALAMTLRGGQFDNECSFRRDDDRVIRYLKGETISLSGEERETLRDGWCLVLVDGYPLGWAKCTGQSLKNKYYPGWRWQ